MSEMHPAIARPCPLCRAGAGASCTSAWDAELKAIPHLSRCESSEEIAMLRELLEQRFRYEEALNHQIVSDFEAAGLGDRWARR